jgi:putative transposase
VKRTYKYRIYPNKMQREALHGIFDFCRFLYNSALEERISHYKIFNKGISYNEQCKVLPEIKTIFTAETANIHSQTLQQVLKQLDAAYQGFFRRIKSGEIAGFPRFKNRDRFRSICFPQPSPDLSGSCIKLLPNKKLKISGLPGEIKVKWHRELPSEARCKQVRIVKQADRYYIAFSMEGVAEQLLPSTGKTIALDLGLTNFITTDDGTQFHHPKPYRTAKEKLAFLNRKRSLKQRGSHNYKKNIVATQRAHQKVVNIRQDFQHKVAKQLVQENDVIIVEKLNIKNMLEAKGFVVDKTNIQDASWGNFVALLTYKAESAGRKIIEVDPRNTSKTCSQCKNIKEDLKLQDRIYHCHACGMSMDRDQNAAINIRRLGTNLAIDQNDLFQKPLDLFQRQFTGAMNG